MCKSSSQDCPVWRLESFLTSAGLDAERKVASCRALGMVPNKVCVMCDQEKLGEESSSVTQFGANQNVYITLGVPQQYLLPDLHFTNTCLPV